MKLDNYFNKIRIENVFVVLAFIFGVTFSILMPLYQVPDEYTHINLIYAERNLNIKFIDVNDGYNGVADVLGNKDVKVNIKEYFDFSKKISVKKTFSIPKITIIRHLPQAIGMIIGEVFKFPVFIYISVCELMALLFYICICFFSLKKMPGKKNIMMMIMLLPICCQQMSSFSYDVVLNSFCFLFVSSVLDLKFNKKKVNFLDLVNLLLFLTVISICKIPYLLFGCLFFLLPFDNLYIFNNIINYKTLKRFFLGFVLILFFLFVIFSSEMLEKSTICKIIYIYITNPFVTFNIIFSTLKMFLIEYCVEIVGNLGWFDVSVSWIFIIYIYFSLFIVNFIDEKIIFKKKDMIFIFVFIVIFVFIIIISLTEWNFFANKLYNYSSLSINSIKKHVLSLKIIGGVQGRYFVPLIPLILLPFNINIFNKITSKKIIILYQLFYYLVLYVYLTFILLNRYWI